MKMDVLKLDSSRNTPVALPKQVEYLSKLITNNKVITNQRYVEAGRAIHVKTNSYINRVLNVLSAYFGENPELTYYLIKNNLIEIESALGFVGANNKGESHDLIFGRTYCVSPMDTYTQPFNNGQPVLTETIPVIHCWWHSCNILSTDPMAYLGQNETCILQLDLALLGALWQVEYVKSIKTRFTDKPYLLSRQNFVKSNVYLPAMDDIIDLAFFNIFSNSLVMDSDYFIDIRETPTLSIAYTDMEDVVERAIIEMHKMLDNNTWNNIAYLLDATPLLIKKNASALLNGYPASTLVDTTIQVLLYKAYSYYFDFNTPNENYMRRAVCNPINIQSLLRVILNKNDKQQFEDWLTL